MGVGSSSFLAAFLSIALASFYGAALAAFAALGRSWDENESHVHPRGLASFMLRDASSVIVAWLVGGFFFGPLGVLFLDLALAEATSGWPPLLRPVLAALLGTSLILLGLLYWKRWAESSPFAYARWAAAAVLPIYLLLYPLRRVLSTALEKLYPPLAARAEFVFTKEDVESITENGEHSRLLDLDERQMIQRIVELGSTTVREIMVPRIDMVAIDETTSLEDVVNLIREKQHSRFPVYRESVDNIVGFLHIKDLTTNLDRLQEIEWPKLIRRAHFVPETKRVDDLLSEMRARRMHLAIVVDEYGGTAGIATLEDVIEEVVGEIQDESDREQPLISRLEDGSFRVDAKMDLHALSERLDVPLTSDQVDTLGGFLFGLAGKIPAVGDRFTHDGVTFLVSGVSGKRITQVIVRPPKKEPMTNGLGNRE